MKVSKLFISGLLCGTLALSPAKVDANFITGTVKAFGFGGLIYGTSILVAKVSGDKNAKEAVQKLENSGENALSGVWSFLKNLGAAAASLPGAIYNGVKKAVNGEGADNAPSYLKNSKDTSYDNQNVISNKIGNKDDLYNEEGGDCPDPCVD